ncbi:hypothetical protein EVA_10839 [gut metagenome]|uniref:Uncharacterized protein n=1 Tax=gut metagenome TaxID=749906 RepID=J9GGW9_9ZZZZ
MKKCNNVSFVLFFYILTDRICFFLLKYCIFAVLISRHSIPCSCRV